MDKDSKSGSPGLPGNALIAAVLLGAGALFLREAPLEGTRPAANEPRIEQRFAQQDIDARLWQDPLGAITRARQDAAARLGAARARAEDERRSDRQLAAEIARKGAHGVDEVVVLAVMLGGGPYAEYVENRRRTRYAVLAGLNAERFAPVDTEHLGYFMPSDNLRAPRDLPETVPYEWFEAVPSGRAQEAGSREVLVLWLDNDAFSSSPFARLRKLVGGLQPTARPGDPPPPRMLWRMLGPTGSDGLRAMVQEVAAADFDGARTFAGVDLRLLSPSATVPDDILLAPFKLGARGQSLEAVLERKGISLLRTIGDDRRLGITLVEELERRGLSADASRAATASEAKTRLDQYRETCRRLSQHENAPSHIALVAEWDTLYGRSLRRQFDIDPKTGRGFCITRLNYVRGLDGQLPDRGAVETPAAGRESGKGADDKNRRNDANLVERAEGQAQLDYLRRLATRLRERDAELRASEVDGAGIRAIGVVGNDVYDKLLVMQALRPEFPNAIFFTTDLDARFLHPREQAWARNLIVASNFGLRLDDGLQAGTPPFRDSYQTSTFLSTRLALDEIRRDTAFTPTQIDAWLKQPRLFEIGRTSAFDFSTPTKWRIDAGSRSCRGSDWANCVDIHPPGSRRYPHVPVVALALIASGTLFLLWFPAFALHRPLRRRLRRFVAHSGGSTAARWSRRIGLLLLALLVHVLVPWRLALAWPRFATWLTGNGEGSSTAIGDGKPISLTEGISIWPTEAIYLLTLLLCVYLVFRGWTALARNLDEISRALHLGNTRRRLVAAQLREDRKLAWWQRLVNIFSCRPPAPRYDAVAAASLDPRMSAAALAFWQLYIVQNRSSARFIRSLACVLVVLVFGWLVVEAFGEPHGAPVRGQVSAHAHMLLAGGAVVVLNFLVFYVADATLFSVRFARDLRTLHSNWPERSIRYFEKRLGKLPPALLDHWIDLQFVARRTKCVTGLIYYPFIVLSLLLISRNPVFDNWRMPTGLMVLALLSVGIVLGCVVALRRVAENSRQHALRAVDEALLRANAASAAANDPPQGTAPASPAQLELLRHQIVDLREGAFAPFSQQPLLKALALPFATLGGTALLDYMAMANL